MVRSLGWKKSEVHTFYAPENCYIYRAQRSYSVRCCACCTLSVKANLSWSIICHRQIANKNLFRIVSYASPMFAKKKKVFFEEIRIALAGRKNLEANPEASKTTTRSWKAAEASDVLAAFPTGPDVGLGEPPCNLGMVSNPLITLNKAPKTYVSHVMIAPPPRAYREVSLEFRINV